MGRNQDRFTQHSPQRSQRLVDGPPRVRLPASAPELREQRILVLHEREPAAGSDEGTGPRFDRDVESAARSVARALAARGHFVEVQSLDSDGDDISSLIGQLQKDPPDLVFNLIESPGTGARHEVLLPSLLEMLAIPYTGSTSLTLGLCSRPLQTRQLLRGSGLTLPPWVVLDAEPSAAAAIKACAELVYPLQIKRMGEPLLGGPARECVTVHSADELAAQVERLRDRRKQPLLVEQLLAGRDLQVWMLGSEPMRILPIQEPASGPPLPERLRIVPPSQPPLPPGVQRTPTTAGLSRHLRERIEQLAYQCFQALELCDHGRCHLRLTADGKLYVLDVYPSCDLAEGSDLAQVGQLAGLPYDAVIEQIAISALQRNARLGKRAPDLAFADPPASELAG
jgi:D-alanine-D-alanine ligase